jgi:hypothetical protein
VRHRGADGATVAGQCSCTSLISRAFPDLWPRGQRLFCHTIDHCRTILYYSVLYQDLASRQRYCRLFTLLFGPGGLTESQILTMGLKEIVCFVLIWLSALPLRCNSQAITITNAPGFVNLRTCAQACFENLYGNGPLGNIINALSCSVNSCFVRFSPSPPIPRRTLYYAEN